MKLVIVVKPIHRPIIPATPAKTGGAGTGNLNAANTAPHPKPVTVDSKMSFMFYISPLLITCSDIHRHQLYLYLLKINVLPLVHKHILNKLEQND